MNLIILSIPVFLLLIAIEVALVRALERPYYRLADSVNDMSCGIVQQVFEIFLRAAIFGAYVWVFERFRQWDISATAAWAWVACYLGLDFLYYWFHRISHEVNAFWAAHVVHHQSEEYNLTVALRQGALQGAMSWVFYLPLAVIGFPPAMFLTVSALDTLYQFWIHTRLVGRLGPLEWVMNTPSHHRVHHGRNPRYIDRNHAGTFIIWDRMFGTFEPEGEEAVFGITTPLASWNPLWANTHYWVELFGKAWRTRRVVDKLRMFVAAPGWNPADLGGYVAAPEPDPAYRKFDTPVPRALSSYLFVQFAVVLGGATALLLFAARLDPLARGLGSLMVVAALVSIGSLFERRAFALPLEATRLVALPLLVGAWSLPAAGVAGVITAASLGWLWRLRPAVSEAVEPSSRAAAA